MNSLRSGKVTSTGSKGALSGIIDNTTVVGPGMVPLYSAASFGNSLRNIAQRKSQMTFGSTTMNVDNIAAPFHGTQAFTGPVPIKKMFRNDHNEYVEGTILFGCKSSNDINSHEITAVAIQNFNAQSERRARTEQKNISLGRDIAMNGSQNIFNAADKKRARNNDPSAEFFPLTQEEFERDWGFMGIVTGSGTKTGFVDKSTNKRLLNVKFYGEARNLPNIWGVKRIGQHVGFLIKEVMTNETSYLGLNGEELGDPTTVPYLQIIPWIAEDSDICQKFPANSSNFWDPKVTDSDYWRRTTTPQQILPTKSNGLPDIWSTRTIPTEPLIHNDYKTGFFIQLGTVTRTTSPFFSSHYYKSSRSFRDYNFLRNESNCDIYINPHPELPVPV